MKEIRLTNYGSFLSNILFGFHWVNDGSLLNTKQTVMMRMNARKKEESFFHLNKMNGKKIHDI